MEWQQVRLGSISTSIQTGPFGSQLHQSDYSDFGTPVVMPKDMINGRIIEDGIARVCDEHVNRLKRHKVKEGDILYSRRGDVGRCAFVTENEKGWLCGTGCLKVELDTSKCLPSFVFYILQREDTVRWVENHAVGSTMPNLNTGILEKLPLSLPPLPTQRRIASILSTYDSLIENNTRRIRLLEQMAENLYKEWFVRFRFPGHENCKIVDGIPEGWRKGALEELFSFKRGKNITSDEMHGGTIPVVAAGIEPSGYHDVSNVHGVSVTMSSSGANAGFIKVHYNDILAADCAYISEETCDHIYYAYELLNNLRVVINNFQRGAAQPHVYSKDVNRIKLVIPSHDICALANEKLGMFHTQISSLQSQNASLARQRDLLLPRLMSGKIEV